MSALVQRRGNNVKLCDGVRAATKAMRAKFPGYYPLRPSELAQLWSTAIFVPDTNILLHLLRYGEETRDQIFQSFGSVRPRLWVPYQIAFEFSRRWRRVDQDNRSVYEKLNANIRAQGNSLCGLFEQVTRHQTIDASAKRTEIQAFISSLCASLEDAASKHPTADTTEKIVDEILSLLQDNIGDKPTLEQVQQWSREAQTRYEQKVPPGYCDNAKDGDEKYGDYIIWQQMLAHVEALKVPLIFISDDRKEDWVLRLDGRDLGPRPELVQEFWDRTGQRFHSYSLTRFLELAAERRNATLSKRTIEEVEQESRRAQEEDQLRRRVALLQLEVERATDALSATRNAELEYRRMVESGALSAAARASDEYRRAAVAQAQEEFRRMNESGALSAVARAQEEFRRMTDYGALSAVARAQEEFRRMTDYGALSAVARAQEEFRRMNESGALSAVAQAQEEFRRMNESGALSAVARAQEEFRRMTDYGALSAVAQAEEQIRRMTDYGVLSAVSAERLRQAPEAEVHKTSIPPKKPGADESGNGTD